VEFFFFLHLYRISEKTSARFTGKFRLVPPLFEFFALGDQVSLVLLRVAFFGPPCILNDSFLPIFIHVLSHFKPSKPQFQIYSFPHSTPLFFHLNFNQKYPREIGLSFRNFLIFNKQKKRTGRNSHESVSLAEKKRYKCLWRKMREWPVAICLEGRNVGKSLKVDY
jgi:hypothetical protein